MDKDVQPLKQLFPALPEVKIRNALTSAGGDTNLTCSILLSEVSTQPSVESLHMNELMHMFPDISREKIEATLNGNKDSLEDTIHDLLCLQSLTIDENNSSGATKSTKPASQKNDQDSDWNRLNDNLKLIMEYGRVPRHIAQDLYIEQRFDPIRSLIQLIYTYKDLAAKYRLTQVRSSNGMIQASNVRGRVQSNHGFAHQKNLGQSALASHHSDVSDPQPGKFFEERSYSYDPRSVEAVSLERLIAGDLKLRSVSHKFMQRALEYFNGELEPTLALAILIVERKYAKHTGHYTLNHAPSVKKVPATPRTVSSASVKVVATKPARIRPPLPKVSLKQSHFRNPDHYSIGCQMVLNILTAPRLDFHGWFPEDAEVVAAECLSRWWKEEQSLRELNNQKLTQIQVMNVPEVTIVTGRGIHSVGRIPKVRNRIQKFLNASKYSYIEESSLFIVNGRKRALCI